MTFPHQQRASVAGLPWQYLLHPWLQFTAVWCLFSFKIFLVSFGEAGLRPDDLLLLLSLAALIATGRFWRTPISLPLRLYLCYVGVELFSSIWNGARGRVELVYSLVFVIRIVEYLIFYFVGYWLAKGRFNFLRVAQIYLVTISVVVPLQMLGLLPVPNTFGQGRASGNTNGPYELAVVCGFLLCYIAFRKRRFMSGADLFALIVLTVSRITLVASIVSLLHFALAKTKSRVTVAVTTAVLLIAGGGFYVAASSGLFTGGTFERVQNSKSYSLDDIPFVYQAAPVCSTAKEYYEGPFSDLNGVDLDAVTGDASGIIRFTRWITLIKSSTAHWDSIWLGLGPSFGSAAVDGYFTRCFVETGIFGILFFVSFLASLFLTRRRSNWYFREYVLIMVISAVFIDIFISYKCMMLLWLWHGMNQYRPQPSRPVPLPLPTAKQTPPMGDLAFPALEAHCPQI